MVFEAPDLRDQEPFPIEYFKCLQALWQDDGVKKAIARSNEAALPEKLVPDPQNMS